MDDKANDDLSNEDRVFESAAELFSVLATPIRLKIISAVASTRIAVTGDIDVS